MTVPLRDHKASATPAQLRAALLAWYARHRRVLPWRSLPDAVADSVAGPWAVLVSEVMLQQTTVATVRSRFAPFLSRFPTPAAMAAEPVEAVLEAWAGLGYYRRARALHACAAAITKCHAGMVPDSLGELRALPGLGAYTAAAVAAIAFERPVVPVDANVARVLARLHAIERPTPALLERHAASLAAGLTSERPSDLAQAVIELGALVCRPQRPACLVCPWRDVCRAHLDGTPTAYPHATTKPVRAARFATAFLARRADGAVLVRRRPMRGLLGGMIELPGTAWAERPPTDDEVAAVAPLPAPWSPVAGTVRHVFTHLDLEMTLLRGEVEEGMAPDPCFWAQPATLALPTLTAKLLRHAGVVTA